MAASTRPLNSSWYSFGIESLGGQVLDELLRQFELGLGHLRRLDAEILEVANLALKCS